VSAVDERLAERLTERVAGADWDAVARSLDEEGGALLPQLLTPAECASVAALYDGGGPGVFRATVDMARHRFGSGSYRYFAAPLPEVVEGLRQALYPRLRPIAEDWWGKLGRPAPWPESLDEWLDSCHRAGQTRPTPLLLRYGAGDWNALHRDLYGDLVFPLQVVINLNSRDKTMRAGSSCWSSSGRGRSHGARPGWCRRGTAWCSPPGTARCGRPGAGRRRRCGTGCRSSGPGSGTRWGSCSTTRFRAWVGLAWLRAGRRRPGGPSVHRPGGAAPARCR
jgi:hypothetical protein